MDTSRKEREVADARLTVAHRDLELATQRYIEDRRAAKAQLEQAAAALRVLEAQVSYATLRPPIGTNAYRALSTAGVKIYEISSGTVGQALRAYRSGRLSELK